MIPGLFPGGSGSVPGLEKVDNTFNRVLNRFYMIRFFILNDSIDGTCFW